MPTGKNWFYFIFIHICFIAGILAIYYFASLKEIEDNWSVYRCNPMYMPLSKNVEEDFAYCVQNMQKNMMGYMLQPITYVLGNISKMGASFTGSINDVREMFNNIRNFVTSIVENIFGVFLNLIIEFQRITIAIKDIIGKTAGIMVTLIYLMDGSMKTMQSSWNGPAGQMTRKLGKCFHPLTLVELKNGKICSMNELELGDVLINGSKIVATMKIDNRENKEDNPLFVYPLGGVSGTDIYVTGSHYIQNRESKEFELVS
jgi:hypothetical protein